MKNLFIKKLIFLLFISTNAVAQDGKYSFSISSAVNTSAGVFKNDSILVRTLWNNVSYAPGNYTKYWDGADDYGVPLISPASTYKVKVVSSNVSYAWEGTIGNASDIMTGATKHRGYYHCMRGLTFGPTYGYFCTGYSEGSPSFGKFDINTPNQKINITVSPYVSTADINYVATDGLKVYWGASDANATSNSFVFGTNVSNDSYVNFSSGLNYAPLYRATLNTISYLNVANSDITGLAVQKSGSYLFVTRAGLNQVQVLNKTTGALVTTLTYTSPKGICVDRSDNLWMISGTNAASKYTVNSDGTLSSPTLTLSGLVSPLAIQVSNDGTLVTVADGGASQQVKFFDNNTGAASATMGTDGGYMADPIVNNSKFYFSDIDGATTGNEGKLPFIAFQANGSFWVNDPGNYRVQQYNSSKTYINRIMSLGSNYSVWVDKNNIERVWAGYLEFAIDYTKPLTGTTGWTLVKNWGAVISGTIYDGFTKFKFPTTLSNGRTYAFLKNGYKMEVVEFPATGQIRFSGLLKPINAVLCSDGSIQDYSESGTTASLKRYPQTGFDGSGNPIWSATSEVLFNAQTNALTGNPVAAPKNQVFSSLNKVVLFNYNAMLGWAGVIPSTGYHLGLMQKGSNNNYLFQTEKSTHRNYSGNYPNAGWFDVGNLVNNYAGGDVNIIDRNIITSYHGEFWKNSQTNKYNHYFDNGLAIGQFGTTRPEISGHAAAGMAGNALTPILVKDGNGNMYLYHGDESDHAAVHRWKIAGLNSISEQTLTISYPAAFVVPAIGYTDLMKDLPFDNTSLPNNTVGWTRNPVSNITTNPYSNYFIVATNVLNYDKLSYPDLNIRFVSTTAFTNTVSRDLGVNNVTSSWKITGEVAYPGNMPNGNSIAQFLEVLDANGKVLTTFYPIIDRNNSVTVYLKANTKNIFSVNGENTGKAILEPLTAFEINVVNGVVTFIYGNYPPVTTSISDATGNWKTPAILRCRFVATVNGTVYGANLGINNLKFYKDYNITPPANIAPLATAGSDKTITLPTNNTTLTGSGTDTDGTISSYSWVKISGPASGTIATANAATTAINNLIQGVYKFELTVTDNNGATGKDTVQVTVNVAGNKAPQATAGIDKTITLPTNSTNLTGGGTDVDGTISSYEWVKISGPSSGTITTSNAATTAISNLVQGVYKFELTVTDNNGATGKDTVQVYVNVAGNNAPLASAGSDKTIILPTNSTILTGGGSDADGTISSYEWIKISGPSSGIIATANAATTAINNLLQGIYQFELTVIDNNGAIGKDTILITVGAAVNQSPTANAGPDQIILLPTNSAILNGIGTDADGTISNYKWIKLTGPAAGNIATPNAANASIIYLVQGLYQFELTVKDNNGSSGKDTVVVTVTVAVNQPPISNAGTDNVIVLPTNSTTLTGTGTDGDGTINNYKWIKVAGPSSGTIATANAASTAINNLAQGIYQFELTVTDNNGAIGKDTVQVTVNAAANQLPIADAGANRLITLPANSVNLNGLGIDFDGNISVYLWTKVSGPSSGSIVSPNSDNTQIINLAQGIYLYELSVTDNSGAVSKDTVQVTVNAALNQPPVADAGLNKAITLPVNSTILLGGGTDADGTITTYSWIKVSGPDPGVIITPGFAVSSVSNLAQGLYEYELTVTDNTGATGKDTVQVTVNDAFNQAPAANAGSNININLPTDSTVLTGIGTDVDGTIAGYSWLKISGPVQGNIVSPSSAVTLLINLVKGIYKYELIVTDDDGAISKDIIQITVNAAPNQAPVANAGPDKVITLPVDSTFFSGKATDADGTITDIKWIKITGPAGGIITSPNAASTAISNLIQGIYQYQLRVTDNEGALSIDTVKIIVNAAANRTPVANAGPDQVITLPTNNTTLTGTGTDADGTIAVYNWVKIAGPIGGIITSSNSGVTAITNLVQGIYQFELTVTDDFGAVSIDTVQVLVNAAVNKVPLADAGGDQTISLPINSTILAGTGIDLDGIISNYKWTKISGPSAGTITSPNSPSTIINNLVQGVYQFELMVLDDKGAIGKDTIQVTVNAAGNIAPLASAGSDKIITLPINNAILTGSGTDADGAISSYSWIKISGPSSSTIATANAATTQINNLVQGVYKFELTVTDNNGATGKDTIQVSVNAAGNIAPLASAGSDKIITLPINNAILTGSGTDADGVISSYSWIKISGPSSGTIVTANAATTQINNLVQGIYKFELTVTDNTGASGKDTVQITVVSAPILNKIPVANAGADFDVLLPINTAQLKGDGVDLDGTIVAYNWKVINGPAGASIINTGEKNTTIENLFQGVYKIEFTVQDNMGASAKDTVSITVSSPRLSTFTKNEFRVFPNPVKDLANLVINSINLNTKIFMSVFDLKGKLVKYNEFVTSSFNTLFKLDLTNLSNGYYVINLRFDDGQMLSQKIIKYGGR